MKSKEFEFIRKVEVMPFINGKAETLFSGHYAEARIIKVKEPDMQTGDLSTTSWHGKCYVNVGEYGRDSHLNLPIEQPISGKGLNFLIVIETSESEYSTNIKRLILSKCKTNDLLKEQSCISFTFNGFELVEMEKLI